MTPLESCEAILAGKRIQFKEITKEWITYNPNLNATSPNPLDRNSTVEWRLKKTLKEEKSESFVKFVKFFDKTPEINEIDVISIYISGWGDCVDEVHKRGFLSTDQAEMFRE
jgi:hypothetical protein